ncbi:hypothetical protein DNTS_030056 [Danionella cerebrum]|uniref:Uncharacterized protein n=1 Tax=Danionella cerebrum TaxID=2873325 RepID=A0A553NJ34_9TELE|nr:hypothetical protein DNTS_030056 [Danionella translucida]
MSSDARESTETSKPSLSKQNLRFAVKILSLFSRSEVPNPATAAALESGSGRFVESNTEMFPAPLAVRPLKLLWVSMPTEFLLDFTGEQASPETRQSARYGCGALYTAFDRASWTQFLENPLESPSAQIHSPGDLWKRGGSSQESPSVFSDFSMAGREKVTRLRLCFLTLAAEKPRCDADIQRPPETLQQGVVSSKLKIRIASGGKFSAVREELEKHQTEQRIFSFLTSTAAEVPPDGAERENAANPHHKPAILIFPARANCTARRMRSAAFSGGLVAEGDGETPVGFAAETRDKPQRRGLTESRSRHRQLQRGLSRVTSSEPLSISSSGFREKRHVFAEVLHSKDSAQTLSPEMPRSFLVKSKKAGLHCTRSAHSIHNHQESSCQSQTEDAEPSASLSADVTPETLAGVSPECELSSAAAQEKPPDLERFIRAVLNQQPLDHHQAAICACTFCAKLHTSASHMSTALLCHWPVLRASQCIMVMEPLEQSGSAVLAVKCVERSSRDPPLSPRTSSSTRTHGRSPAPTAAKDSTRDLT